MTCSKLTGVRVAQAPRFLPGHRDFSGSVPGRYISHTKEMEPLLSFAIMRTKTLFNCIEMSFFTHKLHPRIVISNCLQSSFYLLRFRRAVRQLLEFWRDFQMANPTKVGSWHVTFAICSTLGSQKNNNITYLLHFYQFYKEIGGILIHCLGLNIWRDLQNFGAFPASAPK